MRNCWIVGVVFGCMAAAGVEIHFEMEKFYGGKGKKVYRHTHLDPTGEIASYGKWSHLIREFKVEKEGLHYLWIRYCGNASWAETPYNIREFKVLVDGEPYAVNCLGCDISWQVIPVHLKGVRHRLDLYPVGVDPYIYEVTLTSDAAYLPSRLQHYEKGKLVDDKIVGRGILVDGEGAPKTPESIMSAFSDHQAKQREWLPPSGELSYFEGMNLIPNPGFEYAIICDDLAEPLNWFQKGQGRVTLDADAHGGMRSLRITSTDGEFVLKAHTKPHIDYTKRYQLGFQHKGKNCSGRHFFRVTWLGHDAEKPGPWNVLKTIGVEDVVLKPGVQWKGETKELEPPPGTMHCEFSIHSENNGGTLWLDTLEMDGLGTQSIDFLYPQCGYHPGSSKTMVIWSKDGGLKEFAIMDSGAQVLSAGLSAPQRSKWGRYVYKADFSVLTKPGTNYTLAVGADSSPAFSIESGVYLELARYASQFYYVQRQGIDVPGWHKANFLDDAAIYDKESGRVVGHRDVSGGWQDAGDPSKQECDSLSIYGLAEFYENLRPAWRDLDEAYPDLLSLNWWGVKRIVEKCHLGNGSFMGLTVSNPPKPREIFNVDPANWTDNQPGTDDDRTISTNATLGLMISHLAKYAMVIKEYDQGVADKIAEIVKMNHALRQRELGDTNGVYLLSYYRNRMVRNESYRIGRHNLELMRTAMHLHRLTGEESYQREMHQQCAVVRDFLSRIFELSPSDPVRGNNDENMLRWNSYAMAFALFEYLRYYPGESDADAVKTVLREYLDRIIALARENEFGIVTSLDPERSLAFGRVGRNAAICSYGYIAALGARMLDKPEYRDFAERSAQWVLGRNPAGISMLIGRGHKFAASASRLSAFTPGRGDGVIPAVIRGIGHGYRGTVLTPSQYPALNVAFNPGGRASSQQHEVYQIDTIFLIMLCQELHKGLDTPSVD